MRLTVGIAAYRKALQHPGGAALLLERVAALIRGGATGLNSITDADGNPIGFWEYDP